MEIRKVGVVGCGLMGGGIAQICAQSGFETVVREVSQELLDQGLRRIENILLKDVGKGKLDAAAKDAAMARLLPTTTLDAFADCEIVVEAIVERLDAKRELFAAIDQICPLTTIFASNTSSLTIIEIAAATKRPDRFAGLHFFSPVLNGFLLYVGYFSPAGRKITYKRKYQSDHRRLEPLLRTS
jgi:3-hydroxybutyryl-CoA dehydrogenase